MATHRYEMNPATGFPVNPVTGDDIHPGDPLWQPEWSDVLSADRAYADAHTPSFLEDIWPLLVGAGAFTGLGAAGLLGAGAAEGGGAAAAGLDALGPSTASSMAATTAAEAAPDSLAASLGTGGATAGLSGLTDTTSSSTPGLGSKFLSSLTSEKGLASLASLFGPALAEAFAPTPQTWTGFTGANDPSAAESATTDKLNALYNHINNRNISLPDANLAAPTAHFSGGALPMDIGIHPTSSGPFGNPSGAQPNTGGLSTQDLGGLPGSPNVSRVSSTPSATPASPADYASAHQALQLLKSRPAGNGFVQ